MVDLVIIGGDNYNTLGCVRCFGLKNVPFRLILVTTKKRTVVGSSRYVGECYRRETEKEAIDLLIEKRADWKGSVVIPASDKVEALLDKHSSDLSGCYYFPHCDMPRKTEHLMDKAVQMEYAEAAGLKVPVTFRYHRGQPLPDRLPYPCIIKQENSTEGQKKRMNVCRTEAEVKSALAENGQTDEFLIQQYVERTHELLLIGCRLDDGKVWIPAVFKKTRWMQKGGDASYGIISTDVPSHYPQLDRVKRLIQDMGYYGPFSAEFGVEGNDAFFYEVNMRNDGTSHYFHAAHVFVPYVYYLSCKNLPLAGSLDIQSVEYTFIDEFGDLMNVPGEVTFFRWLKECKEARAYKYYMKSDKRPFLRSIPKGIAWVVYKKIKGQ
mgnify:CR=1 FL=1